MTQDEKAFAISKSRRKRDNWLWKFSFALMILFFLEITFPPLPPRLAFPLGMLSMMATAFFFFRVQRLPIREALLLSRLHNGHLSLSILCTDLELSVPVAETLLFTMERRGLLQVDDDALLDNGELIYKVKGDLL